MGWRWTAITGCWLIWGLLYASRHRLVVPGTDWSQALWYSMPDALLWAALTPLPVYLARRFPPTREGWRRALAPHLAGALVVVAVHPVVDATLNVLASAAVGRERQFADIFVHLVRYGVHPNLMLYATIVGITHFLIRSRRLRERERQAAELRAQLTQARLDALQMQLRPHFLFNTLNTVAALTRSNPAQAREVLVKLSNILRGRLTAQLNFVPLKQELEFVDDYLDIEVVRFGKEKIEIRREIDPETLSLVVPNMLLQPLVENALKHGIGPKIEGGILVIGAQRINGRLAIRVGDNGVGISPERREQIFASGIGISNVLERLKVIYGNDFRIDIDSHPGRGTEIRIEIPEVHSMPAPAALPATTTASRTS